MAKTEQLHKAVRERILLLDGAMGSLIQKYRLTEADFRGERFKDHPSPLQGNNDLLSLTKPDVIREIHEKYLGAGSDIIETNTFNSTRISQADYGAEAFVYEINKAAATIAAEAAAKFSTPKNRALLPDPLAQPIRQRLFRLMLIIQAIEPYPLMTW